MARDRKTSGVAAPEDPQDVGTGFAGDVSAASVMDCNTLAQTHSIWKERIVDLLSEIFELEPALASAWAHAIQARFSWLRRA